MTTARPNVLGYAVLAGFAYAFFWAMTAKGKPAAPPATAADFPKLIPVTLGGKLTGQKAEWWGEGKAVDVPPLRYEQSGGLWIWADDRTLSAPFAVLR